MGSSCVRGLASYLLATVACIGGPAWGQDNPAKDEDQAEATGDIIVTARKRDETSISVPVQLTAVGGPELARRGIVSLDDLQTLVPQLQIAENGGGVQGGTILIRGIGAGESNTFADQAVSFNIDGMQVARAGLRRFTELDIAQIEVLKGPQGLFFGKNSPGGVIAIRTADPGDRLEAGGKLGYEFNAQELRGEGFVSGPLTDTLGVRVAAFGAGMRGWMKNLAPKAGAYAPSRDYLPYGREYGGRLTVLFRPSDTFDARLKLSYGYNRGSGQAQGTQFVFCPLGKPQFGDNAECKADSLTYRADLGTSFTPLYYKFGDGKPTSYAKQTLASLELNYRPSSEITITSLTGYYDSVYFSRENSTATAVPTQILATSNTIWITDKTQELRLATDFKGPLNFLIGAHFQKSDLHYEVSVYRNAVTPGVTSGYRASFGTTDAWSVFGQATWDILDTLELSAGGRYSHEHKDILFFDGRPPGVFDIALTTLVPERSWNNFAPEATLTWRPSSRLTVFAAYKRGYLSGGFNSSVGSVAGDRSYDQQITEGFEAGIKGLFANGKVRANLGVYSYENRGLQLTSTTGLGDQRVLNAGSAPVKGVEFDLKWTTPVAGLSLHGAIGYNQARYEVFTVNCYRGQTIARGCNLGPNAAGVFQLQNLSGQQLVRAPDWTGNGGFLFESPIGSGLTIGLSGDASYSSAYYASTFNAPHQRQRGYWLVDAGLRLFSENNSWDVALIGRNLTSTYYFTRAVDASGTGSAPGTATGATLGDQLATISRGRQIMLRVGFRFDAAR